MSAIQKMFSTLVTLTFGVSLSTWALEPSPSPLPSLTPPEFQWTQSPASPASKDPHQVRVQLDPARKGISVTINRSESLQSRKSGKPSQDDPHPPKSVTITFKDGEGNQTPVDLKAVTPTAYPARYEGVLPSSVNTANQSAIGFEIKIPFRFSKKPKVLRSEDFETIASPWKNK